MGPKLFSRFRTSAEVWSWAFNGLRLASGLLLLPLIVRLLSGPELGMYYVFLSLSALLPVLDLGFSVSVGRHVSYAMGGAGELHGLGLVVTEHGRGPNYGLLHELLHGTHRLYTLLAGVAAVGLGVLGTVMVGLRVEETDHPTITWIAWGVTLAAAVWEIYAGWWTVFLRGMDQVLLSTRLAVLAYTVKLVLAAGLLLVGGGLLAVPIAGLAAGVLQRWLSRRACLHLLRRTAPEARSADFKRLVGILWPTSWRTGLQFSSSYLSTSANLLICTSVFGLVASAEYGLSVQVMLLIQGMSLVWSTVKWPVVGQYRARNDLLAMRRLLWPRVWLQGLTFVLMAVPAVTLGPMLLDWFATGKRMLASPWLWLLALNSLLEMRVVFWTTLLSMENRIPSLWPTVATNGVGLSLVLILVHTAELGLGAFVIGPLVAGSVFNYWYWPIAGARSLGTNWTRFTFRRRS